MRVLGFDPFLTPERAKKLGIEKVELDELLEKADFITPSYTSDRFNTQYYLCRCVAKDKERCAYH